MTFCGEIEIMSDENETTEAEKLFEEAIKLRDSDKCLEAIEKFNEILSKSPKYKAPVLGVMGHIYFKLKDLEKALDCYEKTVNLSPKSELASLGLFHTLWNLGRHDDAFNEMKRFLSLSSSEEYTHLLSEMNQD